MGNDHFIVADFPRTEQDLADYDKAGGATTLFSVYLDCPEDALRERCANQEDKSLDGFLADTVPLVQALGGKGAVRRVAVTQDDAAVWSNVQNAFADTKIQTTYAMIKPDITAVGKEKHILSRLRSAGFQILAQRTTQLSDDDANLFYAEHAHKDWFPGLRGFVTSGPAIALALRKRNAIKAWRAFIGPTNSDTAREQAPSRCGVRRLVNSSNIYISTNRR